MPSSVSTSITQSEKPSPHPSRMRGATNQVNAAIAARTAAATMSAVRRVPGGVMPAYRAAKSAAMPWMAVRIAYGALPCSPDETGTRAAGNVARAAARSARSTGRP